VQAFPSVLFERASDNPTHPQNIEEATSILARAKNAAINIAPEALESVGNKFLAAGRDNSSAWDAGLAFLDYKSFLAARESPYPPRR
jgi:hypothetical protein